MHLLINLYLYTAGADTSGVVAIDSGAAAPYLRAAAPDVCLYPCLRRSVTEACLADGLL